MGWGGMYHDPSPQSCSCLLGGMSWGKKQSLEKRFIYLKIDLASPVC